MNINSCKRCKRLYNGGGHVCSACVQEIDDTFVKVRRYLDNHPRATLVEVVKETESKEKDIMDLLKEGRLSFGSAGTPLKCEKCAAPIVSGKLCIKCRDDLSRALSGNIKQNAPLPAKEKQTSRKSGGLHVRADD